jgi:hypothetical protein
VRKWSDPIRTLHQKRKILQKSQVEEGLATGLANLALPLTRNFLRIKREKY